MKNFRILYIIDGLGPGGKERRLVELLRMLQGADFSIKLVLLTDVIHYRQVLDMDLEIIKLKRKK